MAEEPKEVPADDDNGQVEESTPDVSTEDSGQDDTSEANGIKEAPEFKDLETLAKEKGWKEDQIVDQLSQSYQELERRLGNYKDVSEKAKTYDELAEKYDLDQLEQMAQQAQAYEQARANLDRFTQDNQLEQGNFDLSQAKTDQLAQLWREGRIGLNELPKERQYEVEQFVRNQDQAIAQATEKQAQELTEKYPILKDEYWSGLAADRIEKGMTDPKTGRQLSPDEIVMQLDQQVKQLEKRGEERLKKQTEKIKQGNLESSDSNASTRPNPKIKSIHDAFKAAQQEVESA